MLFDAIELGTKVKFSTQVASGLGEALGTYIGVTKSIAVPADAQPGLIAAINSLKNELTSLQSIDDWENAELDTFNYVIIDDNGTLNYFPVEFIIGNITVIKTNTIQVEVKNATVELKSKIENALRIMGVSKEDMTVTLHT